LKIHKKQHRYTDGVWCKCKKPILVTYRWEKVTCPKCMSHIPGRQQLNLYIKRRYGKSYKKALEKNKKPATIIL